MITRAPRLGGARTDQRENVATDIGRGKRIEIGDHVVSRTGFADDNKPRANIATNVLTVGLAVGRIIGNAHAVKVERRAFLVLDRARSEDHEHQRAH